MKNNRVKIAIILLALFSSILLATYAKAETDKTRKMKAEAGYYFDSGQHYKAVDIWAEVLKIDPSDKEALEGMVKAQKVIEETKSEKERQDRIRLAELIQQGKLHYSDREYSKALSSWGQALSIDPTNKEVLDLIEEARIKARYQISILDKLEREKRYKTPHFDTLDKIANKMIALLEKADLKLRQEREGAAEKEAAEAVEYAVGQEQEFVEETYARGEEFYAQGRFQDAASEWNKILPYLPNSSEAAFKIKEFKEKIAIMHTRQQQAGTDGIVEQEPAEELVAKEADFPGPIKDTRDILAEKDLGEHGKVTIAESTRGAGLGRWHLFFSLVFLLVILLAIRAKVDTGAKSGPVVAKTPPVKTKNESEFDPRDLKKFLNKKHEKDKDLFT